MVVYSEPVSKGNPGESAVYRHREAKKVLYLPKNVQTLYDNFQVGLKKSENLPCLGWHRTLTEPYQFLTYKQVYERALDFGSGLLLLQSTKVPEIGDRPWIHYKYPSGSQKALPVGWHVGIYASNRVDWVIAEQGCNAYSLVTVALYDTLGASTLEYCVNHAELGVVLTVKEKLPNLLKMPKNKYLKLIILMSDCTEDVYNVYQQWAKEKSILIMKFEEVLDLGRKNRVQVMPPTAEDIATICYTSGTTGNPKGAEIMHKNFVVAAHAIAFHGIELTKDDCMISYLPLAHCFERVLQVAFFNAGGRIGFYSGDVLNLLADVAVLRPTFFPSVPRLFNRIYDRLQEATVKAPGFKGYLFTKILNSRLEALKRGEPLSVGWGPSELLMSRIRALLGGRVRMMITGSAPISGDVLNFLRVCFSCEILEGYGQTECAAGSSVTFPGDYKTGQVGAPLVCNEVKLVDVPDMGYLSTDPQPRGEIWIRGQNVMKGYFKDQKKTKETLTEDGWLMTGDIGLITKQGCISIIDRKKNIFKLAQGEYVAPEKLEIIYQKSGMIQQCFVFGDSLQSYLVGVVVPDFEKLIPIAKKQHWIPNDVQFQATPSAELLEVYKTLATKPEVKQLLLKDILKSAKLNKLAGFEVLKNIWVEWEAFSVENDLLTPSFKLKRNLAEKKYKRELMGLYQQGPVIEGSNNGSKL